MTTVKCVSPLFWKRLSFVAVPRNEWVNVGGLTFAGLRRKVPPPPPRLRFGLHRLPGPKSAGKPVTTHFLAYLGLALISFLRKAETKIQWNNIFSEFST